MVDNRANTFAANTTVQATTNDTTNDLLKPKIEAVTNRKYKTLERFIITRLERPFVAPKRSNFVKAYYQPQNRIKSSNLYGRFRIDALSGFFNINHMIMQAPTASYVDYVIYKEADSTKKSNLPPDKKAQLMRQLRFEKTNNQFTSSVLPKTESQHMMRLCITDNVKDHMQMQREVNLGRMVWSELQSNKLKGHFLKVQHVGAFERLLYLTKKTAMDPEGTIILSLQPRPNPRPFFIYEPRGLTLQELLTLSKTNSVDINTARHITVGILHTVRVLHHFGYVHRCVDTTTFGLKKDFNGKILSDAVQCHSLWYARKYRNNKVRRRGPFIGSYLFSSLEAMSGIEQLPNDDMISAMYIFLCLCFGYLPWMKPKTTNGIWNKKSAFQSNPSWFPSRSNVSYNINGIAEAFEAISSYNSLLPNQKIYAKLTEILKKIVDENLNNLKKDEIFVLTTHTNVDLDDYLC